MPPTALACGSRLRHQVRSAKPARAGGCFRVDFCRTRDFELRSKRGVSCLSVAEPHKVRRIATLFGVERRCAARRASDRDALWFRASLRRTTCVGSRRSLVSSVAAPHDVRRIATLFGVERRCAARRASDRNALPPAPPQGHRAGRPYFLRRWGPSEQADTALPSTQRHPGEGRDPVHFSSRALWM